jgi:hypothetical protein
MHGPIDYIIVGFEGNTFDGSILRAVGDAIDKGIIGLVALSVLKKDAAGTVTTLDITDSGDEFTLDFAKKYRPNADLVTDDDVTEIADLVEPDTSVGMLVVEQLWAKPLKKALLDANGVLIAEGRIHPAAAAELDK